MWPSIHGWNESITPCKDQLSSVWHHASEACTPIKMLGHKGYSMVEYLTVVHTQYRTWWSWWLNCLLAMTRVCGRWKRGRWIKTLESLFPWGMNLRVNSLWNLCLLSPLVHPRVSLLFFRVVSICSRDRHHQMIKWIFIPAVKDCFQPVL